MIPWTLAHRRVAATLVLLVLTFLPTVYVALTAWRVSQPGHTREVEVELGRLLNADVSIERIRHMRPGEDYFENFVIRTAAGERETDDSKSGPWAFERLRARRLTAVREPARLSLHTQELRLSCLSFEDLLEDVDTLARSLLGRRQRIELSASTVEVDRHSDRRSSVPCLMLRDVACVVERTDLGHAISSSFRLAQASETGRFELTVARRHDSSAQATEARLQVMEGSLPAGVLDGLVDLDSWFGEEARLQGVLSFRRSARSADWDVEFRGRVRDVDLERLVTAHFDGLSLTGRAWLEIERARWGALPEGQGRGWVEVKGSLVGGRGSIGTTTLASMVTEMSFRWHPPAGATPGVVDFEAIGLAFELTPRAEIRISGALGPDYAPGTVLVSGGRRSPLLSAPEGAANVRGLWRLLFPARDEVLVPAAPGAEVMRHLPMPAFLPEARREVKAN